MAGEAGEMTDFEGRTRLEQFEARGGIESVELRWRQGAAGVCA